LYSDPHKIHKYIVWEERGIVNVKLVVHISDHWALEDIKNYI